MKSRSFWIYWWVIYSFVVAAVALYGFFATPRLHLPNTTISSEASTAEEMPFISSEASAAEEMQFHKAAPERTVLAANILEVVPTSKEPLVRDEDEKEILKKRVATLNVAYTFPARAPNTGKTIEVSCLSEIMIEAEKQGLQISDLSDESLIVLVTDVRRAYEFEKNVAEAYLLEALLAEDGNPDSHPSMKKFEELVVEYRKKLHDAVFRAMQSLQEGG